MCSTQFVHLHTHTEYSPLDGACKLHELLLRAKELGQKAIAITDHGSMSGLWNAQKLGDGIGVKVILGSEYYYERENDGENGHLIVLAKNNIGLQNMMRLQEYAYVHNFYKKPRINWETLIKHKEGLIVSSACLASTFSQYLMNAEVEKAYDWAKKFKQEFGDDFYLEVQANTLDVQALVNKETMRIAKQLDIKVIATNDIHYTLKTDSFSHEVLLAMQVKKKMSDVKRFKFDTEDFWLKSREEMFESLHGLTSLERAETLHATSEVANKCTARFEQGHYLPDYYDIPKGQTARTILVNKIKEGIRHEGMSKETNFLKDVQNEVDVIDRNGYSGYFLIVSDFVNTARQRGNIVGDGRGSGAGSKVAWLTGITKIPPHHYDLLFERFLADGREPDSIESSDMETYHVKFGERLVNGVHLMVC